VTDLAIHTEGLTKRFPGGQVAVDSLDLAVPAGSVFGFLGPNGSGKTTTIRMLLGLVSPTSGVARLLGAPIPDGASRVLPRVGALVEGPAFHPYLNGYANLRRLDVADRTADPKSSRGRILHALDQVGLGAAAGKKYRRYSLGMRQRLALAAALLQPRDLLVLDEPTNGLDPQGTREVRALIRTVAAGGTTVFLSTHLLAEVAQICTHVAVMRTGRLVAQSTLDELRAGGNAQLRVETPATDKAMAVLTELGLESTLVAVELVGAELNGLAADKVCAALVHADVPVFGFTVERPSLEDRYVALTGEGFDVD
jgi:ABC-2 type transport system ATP-binding protein